MATFPKPTKAFIKGHLFVFVSSALFTIIALIWMIAATKHYENKGSTWLVFLVLTVILWLFAYYFSYREDTASAYSGPKAGPQWWHFVVGLLAYGIIIFAITSTARSQRVDNCIPGEKIVDGTGYIPNAEKYIGFYEDKPCNKMLLDAPLREYIKTNHRLPGFWMDKSGYTSQPVQWWNYYYKNPLSAYKLTPDVQAKLYETGFLPLEAFSGEE